MYPALTRRAPIATLLALLVAATPAIGAADGDAAVEFHAKENAPPGMSLPFSESVRVGDLLYLSGEIGTDAHGKLVSGGIGAETKQIMDNIGASLARRGASFDDVVQCTVALGDIADWPAFNEVYRGYFPHHFPARMAFAVNGLALGARAEVQCNAAVPARAKR